MKSIGSLLSMLVLMLILSMPLHATAAIVFSDNFNDGNTTGWTFYGTNSGSWSVPDGRLHHVAPAGYTGVSELAIIDGVTTPDQFTLEADISVVSSINGSDWGHVGFAWGVTDLSEPFDSLNTSYLRTHQDLVTNWSVLNGSSLGEQFLNTSGTTTNGVTYHLSVDVDYLVKSMTVTMDTFTTTFTGTDFDKINQNTGGGIGLISWKDHITFDNVLLSTPNPVPEPSLGLLLGISLIGLVGAGAVRKIKRRKVANS